nr:hypothetical protein [Tanacetum cinerariifolium]
MRIDELYKFSDGTLNDVRTALDDRLKGIRMQYLPQTIWRKGDKDRAAAMIQAIDKMLKTRRIMRSLEKFVGGRLTRIVEENLHIRFSESTSNVVGSRPDWLFDIDALTRKINFESITADPPFSQDAKSSHDYGSKPSSDDEKKVEKDPRKENECNDQEKEDNVNSTNNVNTDLKIQTFLIEYTRLEKHYVDYIKLLEPEVKNASTPIETQKPLLKDEDGEEVDVHMYRSIIGSLMYLTS